MLCLCFSVLLPTHLRLSSCLQPRLFFSIYFLPLPCAVFLSTPAARSSLCGHCWGCTSGGTNSGCWVAAIPHRETFIKQNGAGPGAPAATYAPACLSWAVAPTHLGGLFDGSIAEREKPYGGKRVCASSFVPQGISVLGVKENKHKYITI